MFWCEILYKPLIKFYDRMDEDINSFLLFCGANTALANQSLQPGIELYHNRGVLLSPIVAGFLSTTTRKKLLIGSHLLLVTTMGLAQLATTRSADCFSQNPTASKKCSATQYCQAVMYSVSTKSLNELATCGLRQITVKLWKFFTDLSRPRCGLPW
jgi:hypothetical protein